MAVGWAKGVKSRVGNDAPPPPRRAPQNIPRFPERNPAPPPDYHRLAALAQAARLANANANAAAPLANAAAPVANANDAVDAHAPVVNAAPVQQPRAALPLAAPLPVAEANRQNDVKVSANPVFSLLGPTPQSQAGVAARPAAGAAPKFLFANPRSLPIATPLTREEILGFQAEEGMPGQGLRERRDGFAAGEQTLGANLAAHAAIGAGSYLAYRREAARVAFDILTNQSFEDGNHRTALQAMYGYLLKNGLRMARSPVLMYGKLQGLWQEFQGHKIPPSQLLDRLAKYVSNIRPFKSQEEADQYAAEFKAEIAALPAKIKQIIEAKPETADKSSAEERELAARVRTYRKMQPESSEGGLIGARQWTKAQRKEWHRRKREAAEKKDDLPKQG